MRLVIAAVGRLKDGPERDLVDRYRGRLDASGRALGWGFVQVIEIGESRASDVAARQNEEAERLISRTGDIETKVVLDENGRQLSSEAFAAYLRGQREKGVRSLG